MSPRFPRTASRWRSRGTAACMAPATSTSSSSGPPRCDSSRRTPHSTRRPVGHRTGDRSPSCGIPGGAEGRIHLISPLGGIAPSSVISPRQVNSHGLPDGRILAAARWQPGATSTGIFAIPIDGGEPCADSDEAASVRSQPGISPDGRRLAYMCCPDVNLPTCNVCVLDLDATYRPAGAPRRLTADPVAVRGLRWSRDGHSIIYGTQPFPGLAYLWRIAIDWQRPRGTDRGGWSGRDGPGTRAFAKSPGLHPVVS